MKQTNLRLCCLVVLCVVLFVVNSTAKPNDFSELDRLVPEELKATNTLDNGKPVIIRPMFNNTAMWPAGSIFSNAQDLSRWVIALLNEGRVDGQQVLSASLINQMVQHHIPVPGETDSYYGHGLTVFKYKGLEFVGHGGFSRGYGSMIQMVPSRKFAVIVLTNKSGDKKFTFGDNNENELVFVRGKSGKIDFLFSELYSAKRVGG